MRNFDAPCGHARTADTGGDINGDGAHRMGGRSEVGAMLVLAGERVGRGKVSGRKAMMTGGAMIMVMIRQQPRADAYDSAGQVA